MAYIGMAYVVVACKILMVIIRYTKFYGSKHPNHGYGTAAEKFSQASIDVAVACVVMARIAVADSGGKVLAGIYPCSRGLCTYGLHSYGLHRRQSSRRHLSI